MLRVATFRSKSRVTGRFRLIQAKVRSTIPLFWQHNDAIELGTFDDFAVPVGASAKMLADFARVRRLPAVTLFTNFGRDGSLMA
jgi:hypothetical protein